MRGVLDTSVVLDLGSLPVELLPDEAAITVLTMAELAAGPHATDDPVERTRRQSQLQWAESSFDPLPFDAAAARAYGQIYGVVRASGRRARGRVIDLQIAAVAAANGLPLYTRNPKDFVGLEQAVKVNVI